MAWNWPRISSETNGELSAGKLGSRIGVNISKLWFVFRRPCSTPASVFQRQNTGSRAGFVENDQRSLLQGAPKLTQRKVLPIPRS
jgi:hypothetical protein